MTKPQPKPVITPDMRSRINRIAHAESLKHAVSARQRITAELQHLVDSGAPSPDLDRHLSRLESNP